MSSMRPIATGAPILVAAALLAGGCGGGAGTDSGTADSEQAVAAIPSPEQPISTEVTGFERALANKSCREFFPFVFSTLRNRPPGSPATKEECLEEPLLAAQYLQRVDPPIADTREYATGALMEAPVGKGLAEYTVWVLDADGRFRFAESEGVFHPQFGTSVDRPEAERVAEEFVRAVRRDDCAALVGLLHFSSRFVAHQKSRRAICEPVLDGVYFAPAVRATPEVEVEVLGGTRSFVFVGIPTGNAYFTLHMGQSSHEGGGLQVIDVLPNTPLEQPEA